MDQTFMTIHELGPDATILFASDSITDILGYHPDQVQDKSCFDFFHPDEVPFARSIHSRGVLLDKAAVLHYVRIRSLDGQWVSCECCFTVVHDVLVACISIYQPSEKSQKRAVDAPQIRRLFSCSPKDPRYHMLQELSPKFEMPPAHREPRAALILNRFTRSLSVMFCTNAIASVLGLPANEIQDKSFYECIQESCLEDAVRCLESAKANDSIAYMRFWSRDPRSEEDLREEESEEDEDVVTDGAQSTDGVQLTDGMQHDGLDGHAVIKEESDGEDLSTNLRRSHQRSHDSHLSDSDSGGVRLDDEMDIDSDGQSATRIKSEGEADGQSARRVKVEEETDGVAGLPNHSHATSNGESATASSASGGVAQDAGDSSDGMNSDGLRSSTATSRRRRARYPLPSVELEAVVSCTSDGLVVILRRARPLIPGIERSAASITPRQGVFAAPWGQQAIRPQYPVQAQNHSIPAHQPHQPVQATAERHHGPPDDYLMQSIREIAVFAWALVGINGNLASYSRGNPMAGAQPAGGLPIWDPNAGSTTFQSPENQAVQRWAAYDNGTLAGPSRGLGWGRSQEFSKAPNTTASKQYGGFAPNGYNTYTTNGHNDYTPNGNRDHASNGHRHSNLSSNSSMNGHSNLDSHNHNYSATNGYSYNTNGRNYTYGSNAWPVNTHQSDGTSGNRMGQSHFRDGIHHVQTDGNSSTGLSDQAAWNFVSGIPQNGFQNGHSSANTNPSRDQDRWPQ